MDISKYIKQKIEQYERDEIEIVKGLTFNAYENFRTIEFIANSKYLSGQSDRRGKLKPFYNITNFRVNVATRATDIDTKDIQIQSDTPDHTTTAFLLQKGVYNWMKESNYAKKLNEMGYTRAKYGHLLIKKCEYNDDGEDELEIEVVDWNNVAYVDQTEPEKMVVERHYMDAQDLSEKMDVWENVEDAMDLIKKTKDGSIEVYEATGYIPDSFAPDGESEYDYKLQKFFLFFKGSKKDATVLYHEYLKESPYKSLAWEKVSKRLGRGVIEDGFEAQKWVNDAVIKEKEAMELGSKVIFKSTDPNIQNNVLTEVENGQIIKISQGTDLSIANTITNALPEFSKLKTDWDGQYERVSSTFNAITGETMPSGTAFRSVAIQNQEATSMFDYRREEMGIFQVEVFTEWIIPFLIKKFNKPHILAAEFSPEELNQIDKDFGTFQANEKVNKLIDSGKLVYAEDYGAVLEAEIELLRRDKNVRFIDIPKGYFKNWEPRVTIITTGEQRNKAVVLESLNNILLTIGNAPQILTDPTMSKIFAKILEVSGTGISPLSLGLGQTQGQPAQLPEQVALTEPQPMAQTASQVAQA